MATNKGVEVEVSISNPTLPVSDPVLLPVIVGPCKEIVSATSASGGANSAAKVVTAAMLIGTDEDATKDVSGLSFRVSLGGDADQEVDFPISPSGSELGVALVATLLDEGITDATFSSLDNMIQMVSVATGDDASIQLKKGKIRVVHGAVTAGPFAVADACTVSGNSVGTITYVGSGFVILDTFGTTQAVTGTLTSGGKSASITSTLSAYTALGLASFVDVLVEGSSTYKNRQVTVPFSSIPTSRGTIGQLDYDLDTLLMYRLQTGRMVQLEKDAATLRSRLAIGTTNLGAGRVVVPESGNAYDSTSVTYTSAEGIKGSELSVQHMHALILTLGSSTAGYTVGETVVTGTGNKIIGTVLAKSGSTLTVGFWGSAVIGDLAADTVLGVLSTTSIAYSSSAVLPTPVVDIHSRIVAYTVADASGFTSLVGSTVLNGSEAGNQVTIGTILDVDATNDIITISVTGYHPFHGDTLKVGGTTTTIGTTVPDDIEGMTADRAIVVYLSQGTATAIQVADAVNRANTGIVIADVGGTTSASATPGQGLFPASGAADGTVVWLSPIEVSSGSPAQALYSGAPYDDRNGDTKTPYFWSPGVYASLVHGSGNAALTFEARGNQTPASPGNFHGAYGNDLTVTLVECSVATIAVSNPTTTSVLVKYGASHTATQIAAAINADSQASAKIIATAGGTGAGTPASLYIGRLHGGRSPINLQGTPDECVVIGQRDLAHFGYVKATVGDASSFQTGEAIRLTDASGGVVGVLRELNDTYGVLWVDPTWHTGTAAAGGASTITLEAVRAILVDDTYNGWTVNITGGTGSGQTRTISDYTGSTRVATVSEAWATNPDNTSTYEIVAPADITAASTLYGVSSAATATVSAVTQEGVQVGDTLTVRVSGGAEYTTTFTSALTDLSAVDDVINAAVGAGFCTLYPSTGTPASNPFTVLKLDAGALSGQRKGAESTITLGGTAVEKLFGLMPGGLTYAGAHEGAPYKVLTGDEVWNGTTKLGTIAAIDDVQIGSRTFTKARLRITTNTLVTTASYSQWWVKAKKITLNTDLTPKAVGGEDRPTPGLIIDEDNERLLVAQAQARLTDGRFDANASQGVYVDYTATRQDLATGVLKYSTYLDMENEIGPVTPSNPLAWACYIAQLNAPNTQIGVLGVDDTSTAEPDGTYASYVRALEILSAYELYSLVPLTRARDVGEAFDAHVIAMSAVAGKKERIVWRAEATPTEEEPTLVGSGTGTLDAVNTIAIDPDDLNVIDALVAAGIEDPESMSWSDLKTAGVYLQITSDTKKYSVSSISGQTVTVATEDFEPGDNTDLFYATTDLDPDDEDMAPAGETVTLKVRGDALTSTTATGRDAIITAMSTRATSLASSRTRFVQPDRVGMTFGGVEQVVPSYYACAGLAGRVAGQKASQGMTNQPITGLTRVLGSTGTFTETQLDAAKDAGVWWLVQPVKDGNVTNYHQVTTDLTDIRYIEHSIVTARDWVAKSLRTSVNSTIGTNTIDDALLSLLSITTQGVMERAQDGGIVAKGAVTSIAQSSTQPDAVEIGAVIQPLFPCNKIKFSLST